MSRFNLRQQRDVSGSTFARHAAIPVLVTAGRDFELFAHGVDR